MGNRSMSLRHASLGFLLAVLAAVACLGLTMQTSYAEGEAAALPEAENGVITLTGDVVLENSAVFTEGETTLDLAGHTITGTSGGRAIVVTGGAKMTVTDSSENAGGAIFVPKVNQAVGIYVNGGTLTVDKGALSVSGDEAAGIWIASGGKVVMAGGSITASGMSAMCVGAQGTAEASFTLEKGSLSAEGYGVSGIYLAGQNQNAVVNGGTIRVNGNGSYGIQAGMMDSHKVEVNGGEITASGTRSNAVFLDEGNSLTVTGGSLISTDGAAVSAYRSNTISVTGGTISGKTYGIQCASSGNTTEISDEATVTGGSGGANNPTYVLMNIPYADFYAAELGEGAAPVDAVTSATKNKPRTGGLAGGSYHKNADGTDISGVIYPVYVKDPTILKGKTRITDESSVDITVTNRGTTTTTTYEGKDALFESGDYSYYKLSGKPGYYKELNVGEDGSFHFGAVSGDVTTQEGVTGDVTTGARHADIEIKLSGTEGIAQGAPVSAVVLTDADGKKYGLRHVVNVWRATEIGWNVGELDLAGKTITNIRYITQDAVIDYPVSIGIGDAGYVLMNIPYADFYAAELGEGAAPVDAVTSATKNKPRTGGLAGGSYHKNADGTDISGVIYPVFVKDMSVLKDKREITDESSVDITVTNRGQTATTTYTGRDALFESDDYSYYRLSAKPARSKVLTVGEDGTFTFGAASGRAQAVGTATGAVTAAARHAEIEIKLTLPEGGMTQGAKFAGAIITDDEGNQYALRHVVNVWRGTEIGWNTADLDFKGKKITNIRYFTEEGTYSYDADIEIPSGDEIQARLDVKAAQTALNKLPEDASSEDVLSAYQALSDAYHALADAMNASGKDTADLTAALQALDDSISRLQKAETAEKDALEDQVEQLQGTVDGLQGSVDGLQKAAAAAATDISNFEAKLSRASFPYTGRAIRHSVKVKGLKAGDYTVSYTNNVKIGTAKVTIKGNAVKKYSGTISKTFQITKKRNTMAVKVKTVKAKAKKKTTIKAKKAFKVTKAVGKVTYKKVSGNKKITVAKNGKITVKKGLKKKTYKIRVAVRAAGSATYAPAAQVKTVKIRVR